MSLYGSSLVLYYCVGCSVSHFLTGCLRLKLLIYCPQPRPRSPHPHPRICCCFGFHFWFPILCCFGSHFLFPLLCCLLGLPLLLHHGILWICHWRLVRSQMVGQDHHNHLDINPHYRWLSHLQDDKTHHPRFTLHWMGHSHLRHNFPRFHFHSCQWMLFPLVHFGQGHEWY